MKLTGTQHLDEPGQSPATTRFLHLEALMQDPLRLEQLGFVLENPGPEGTEGPGGGGLDTKMLQ